MSGADRERPERQVHQQAVRVRGDAPRTPPAARSRPCRGRRPGSRPAPSPTQDAASIWNGSHGPTPAVSSAEANSEVEPSTKPKPGSEHPAGQHEQEEDRLDAGGAGAERPQRGVDRGQHAEHRQRLGVDPAGGDLGQHDDHEHRQDEHEDQRRVAWCARRRPAGGEISSGQTKTARPAAEASRSTSASARHRRSGARRTGPRGHAGHRGHSPGPWSRQRGGDLGPRSATAAAPAPWPPAARRPARRPRRPRSARRRPPRPRPAPPPGRRPPATNSTSWVASTTAGPAPASSREHRARGAACPGSPGPGSARPAAARAARRPAGSPAPARAAVPRTGRAGAGRRRCPAPAGRAAPRQVPAATVRLAVGLRALRGDRVQVEQVGRGLRHQADPPAGLVGGQRPGSAPAPTTTVPACRGPEPCSAQSSDDLPDPLRPISATTSPAAQVEVDVAGRPPRRRTAPTTPAGGTAPAPSESGRRRRAGRARPAGPAGRPARRRASRTDSGSGSQPASRPSSTTGGATGESASTAAGGPDTARPSPVSSTIRSAYCDDPLQPVLGHHAR